MFEVLLTWHLRFRWLKANGDYFIVVIEDTKTKKLAGAATTFVESKFIRNLGKVQARPGSDAQLRSAVTSRMLWWIAPTAARTLASSTNRYADHVLTCIL